MQDWQELVGANCTASAFRKGARNALGNPAGPPVAVDGLQDMPCRFNPTDNYDEVAGPQGRSKVNNIMTSDKAYLFTIVDLRADDLVRIDRGEESKWYSVAGSPKKWEEDEITYLKFYMTTIPVPVGV